LTVAVLADRSSHIGFFSKWKFDIKMSQNLNLKIITPTEEVFSGSITGVTAPGADGYFGVLVNHAPLVTSLQVGEVKVNMGEGAKKVFAISSGFVEVSANNIIILADSAEEPSSIDVKRSEKAKERAAKRITEGRKGDWDVDRAQVALAKAINRIRIASKKAN